MARSRPIPVMPMPTAVKSSTLILMSAQTDAGTMDVARGGTVVDFQTDTRMLSQELRYASNFEGPVQLTVGALYWDENVDQTEQGLECTAFYFRVRRSGSSICSPLKPRACPTTSRATLTAVLSTGSSSGIPQQLKLSFEGRYPREAMDVTGTVGS